MKQQRGSRGEGEQRKRQRGRGSREKAEQMKKQRGSRGEVKKKSCRELQRGSRGEAAERKQAERKHGCKRNLQKEERVGSKDEAELQSGSSRGEAASRKQEAAGMMEQRRGRRGRHAGLPVRRSEDMIRYLSWRNYMNENNGTIYTDARTHKDTVSLCRLKERPYPLEQL
jgi:hypothetical protein